MEKFLALLAWTVMVCILLGLYALATVGIVLSAVVSVGNFLCLLVKTPPARRVDQTRIDSDEKCVDDLVDGTAMGLINWDE